MDKSWPPFYDTRRAAVQNEALNWCCKDFNKATNRALTTAILLKLAKLTWSVQVCSGSGRPVGDWHWLNWIKTFEFSIQKTLNVQEAQSQLQLRTLKLNKIDISCFRGSAVLSVCLLGFATWDHLVVESYTIVRNEPKPASLRILVCSIDSLPFCAENYNCWKSRKIQSFASFSS